jgi:putative glutamine amidotransferase
VQEDSLLARVLGTTAMAVNSWHHQAVKEVGQGLRVNCRARDGVIEGLEAADGRPILGVQFHPEECTAAYPQFRILSLGLTVARCPSRRRSFSPVRH